MLVVERRRFAVPGVRRIHIHRRQPHAVAHGQATQLHRCEQQRALALRLGRRGGLLLRLPSLLGLALPAGILGVLAGLVLTGLARLGGLLRRAFLLVANQLGLVAVLLGEAAEVEVIMGQIVLHHPASLVR